jgi:hypothetical protein
MESITAFVNIENAKTKINTIARDMLGMDNPLEDHIMEDLVEQVLIFLSEIQELSDADNPDILLIIADMFVATMIITFTTAEKLKETVQAYDQLHTAYTILKEKHES